MMGSYKFSNTPYSYADSERASVVMSMTPMDAEMMSRKSKITNTTQSAVGRDTN